MIAVVYAYYEKNLEYANAFRYFQAHGIEERKDIHYYIVVNGKTSVPIPEESFENVHVIHRKNEGFDFGAYNEAAKYIESQGKTYDYYFFLNTSAVGPFLPQYVSKTGYHWTQPFIDRFLANVNVRQVGPTINIESSQSSYKPHVQSYAMAFDNKGFRLIMDSKKWDITYDRVEHVIENLEIGTSAYLIEKGYEISCLIPELQNIVYGKLKYHPHPNRVNDMIYDGKKCFGRDLHPYETIFLKINRSLAHDEIRSLMRHPKYQ